MLFEHFSAVENELLAKSMVSANAGHPLHKGTPREAFIRDFLINHLSSDLAIGTGEIIDFETEPKDPRRQFDIVLHKRNLPKLTFGGDINAFLAESVFATIEVKSTLDKAGIKQAMTAAAHCKGLKKSLNVTMTAGFVPPASLNYIVAYDGPSNLQTIAQWVQAVEIEMGYTQAPLPIGPDRYRTPSASIDGIFVLGKGFVLFDNLPFGFVNDSIRHQYTSCRWAVLPMKSGTLMWLFQLLTQLSQNMSAAFLDSRPYARKLTSDSFMFY